MLEEMEKKPKLMPGVRGYWKQQNKKGKHRGW